MLQTILNSASSVINQVLQQDPKAAIYLEKLEGACIQVEIESIIVYLVFDAQELLLSTVCPEEPITTIQGPIHAFIPLILNKSPRKAANLGLRIEGDLAVGEALQSLFFDLNLDWEAWLSQWMGDMSAYKIGDIIRTTHHKSQHILKKLSHDTRHYIQDTQLVPTPEEAQGFIQGVDSLRATVDRLEARLQRLEIKQGV